VSPSAVRRERALWCLNLDAEDELRHGLGYTPRQATLAAVAAARAGALSLLAPGDVLLDDAPTAAHTGRVGLSWCPTPTALARLRAAGARVPPAPDLATLQRVNASRFTYDVLGARLSGAVVVTEFDEAKSWLEARSPEDPVWLKRAFGAAGRGKLRAMGGELAAHTRAFLSPLELSLGVVLEPDVRITLEVSQHGFVTEDGSLETGVPVVTQVERGRFVSVRSAQPRELEPAEITALRSTLERVAGALHAAGYFGPFGIDAYRYADAHGRTRWNPCGELNARYTMGYALGMADRPATE